MSQNETGRPPERPAVSPITCAKCTEQARHPAQRQQTAPVLIVTIEFEGRVEAVIRDVRGSDSVSFRAWLETDDEMREFCRLTRRLRDRMAA